MTQDRPEELYPLFRDTESLKGIGGRTGSALERIGIRLVRDLLLHLPDSVIDRAAVSSVSDIEPPAHATVRVRVERHLPGHAGRPHRIEVIDAGRRFALVYFGSRTGHLKRQFPVGGTLVVSGKVEKFGEDMQMTRPEYVVEEQNRSEIPSKEPVYGLTEGVTNRSMRRYIDAALAVLPDLPEWHDRKLINDRSWPSWSDAVRIVHSGDGSDGDEQRMAAMERLAFDELTANQLALAIHRNQLRLASASATDGSGNFRAIVMSNFGHALTEGQSRVVDEILADLSRPERMVRLLQGDVGSGKTMVALLSLVAAVEAGGQGVLMLPTEILARQQFDVICALLDGTGVSTAILTGSDRSGKRKRTLELLRSGEIGMLVGTQAVIQSGVEFQDLRLAVVDEQHRFGVDQRRMLLRSNSGANLLMMTATPIPRSLALVKYGEADVSTLDDRPAGRARTRTAAMPASRLGEVVERLRLAVEDGRQAYWICPIVEETSELRHSTPEQRAVELSSALGNCVGIVHGRMHGNDKIEAMQSFLEGKTRILVATSVVEVGMDVPNASIMVIESAELFGLAQLHQLRGRVGRGVHESACVLIHNPPLTDMARARLSAIRATDDGFRIADADLKLRGGGELTGVRQSGTVGFRCADPHGQPELLEEARRSARSLVERNPDLASRQGTAARNLLFLFDQDQVISPSGFQCR